MKFLIDFFPVLLFFSVYSWGNHHLEQAHAFATDYLGTLVSSGTVNATLAPILLATAIAMVATVLQIAYLLLRRKKIDGMLWLSFFIISVFGGATIYFQNDTFIKLKPTVLYWCFGAGLMISQGWFKKNPIRLMLQEQLTLPEPIWSQLNLAWALFFVIQGLLNLYVAFYFSQSVWVSYKAFGATGLMVLFVIGQVLYLGKHMQEPQ